MKVKFLNNVVKKCTAPIEQKIFKNLSGDLQSVGWLLNLRLMENITSSDLDLLITRNNIGTLEFTDDSDKTLFVLSGYDRVTSTIIRHSDNAETTSVEIQLSK